MHCTEINLIKCLLKNECSKAIYEFLMETKKVTLLNLAFNLIEAEGCKYLGMLLHPSIANPLDTLILDHNSIGSAGLAYLCNGLNTNSALKTLSLSFCDIDCKGGTLLSEMLCFVNSEITTLNLEGNHLRNEGIISLCPGLSIAKSLKEINIIRNEFGEEKKVIDALLYPMMKNDRLKTYFLHENGLNSPGIRMIRHSKSVYESNAGLQNSI